MIESSVLVLAACLCVHLGDASLCKPLSTFVIDCNNCTCSKNGMEYSCTNFVCPPIKYEDKYDVKIINGGYRVLVPKNTKRSAPNEEDSALNPKKRVPRVSKGFPYINGEIPSSREMEKHIRERSNNDIDERYNNDIDSDQMDYSDDRDSYGKRYSGRNRNNNDIFEGDNNDIEDRDNSDIDERRYMGRRRYNDIDENEDDENEDEENDLSFDEADEDEDSEWMSEEDNNYNDDESNYIDEDTDRNRRGRYRRKSLRSQPYKIRK